MTEKNRVVRNIWMVTREYGNFAGAGGVRDVVRQLATHLACWNGRKVSVVMPLYGFMDVEKMGCTPVFDPYHKDRQLRFRVDMNYPFEERQEEVLVWKYQDGRVVLYCLESQRFEEKNDVYVYSSADQEQEEWKKTGTGHYDYFAMNILLQKGAVELIMYLDQKPDLIHCHDGHAAVLPAMINELAGYRSYFRLTGCVVTIHNAGYGYHQEVADLPFAQTITGLPWKVIEDSLLENKFDPFIAASRYALFNTVSENHARELQYSDIDASSAWLGHELLRRNVEVEGITNGIDLKQYDPLFPEKTGLVAGYDTLADDILTGKKLCKEDLLLHLDGEHTLPVAQNGYLDNASDQPLFTFVGRLSDQKGVDILLDGLNNFFTQSDTGMAVILGSGEEHLENRLSALVAKNNCQGRLCFLQGFDPAMANRVYAAGDFFLIPSRYEPCGLTDFIAQIFGNLPIVNLVGGLVKVEDGITGFGYTNNGSEQIVATMFRAIDVYRQPEELRSMQKNARKMIDRKYLWSKVIKKYALLYKKAVMKKNDKL